MLESKRIAEIRQIAKEADDFYSGRWVVEDGPEGWSLNTSVGSNESPAWLGDFGAIRTAADHCAAFDPATAIALCDGHEALRARVEALEAALREAEKRGWTSMLRVGEGRWDCFLCGVERGNLHHGTCPFAALAAAKEE